MPGPTGHIREGSALMRMAYEYMIWKVDVWKKLMVYALNQP